jgi:hypothetical protein
LLLITGIFLKVHVIMPEQTCKDGAELARTADKRGAVQGGLLQQLVFIS